MASGIHLLATSVSGKMSMHHFTKGMNVWHPLAPLGIAAGELLSPTNHADRG